MPSPSAPKPSTVVVKGIRPEPQTIDTRDIAYAEIVRVALYKKLGATAPTRVRLSELGINYSLSTTDIYQLTGAFKTQEFWFDWIWDRDHLRAHYHVKRALVVEAVTLRQSESHLLADLVEKIADEMLRDRSTRKNPLW